MATEPTHFNAPVDAAANRRALMAWGIIAPAATGWQPERPPGRLRLASGHALRNGQLFEHCWLVDPDNTVIEVLWDRPGTGYFGSLLS